MLKSLVLLALSVGALAVEGLTPVVKRTAPAPCFESGDIRCGDVCIPKDHACCPDKSGGCHAKTAYCMSVTNDKTGCCAKGDKCNDAFNLQDITTSAATVVVGSSNTVKATSSATAAPAPANSTVTTTKQKQSKSATGVTFHFDPTAVVSSKKGVPTTVSSNNTVTTTKTVKASSKPSTSAAKSTGTSGNQTTQLAAPTKPANATGTGGAPRVTDVNGALVYGGSIAQAAVFAAVALLFM
ncbi:hypothetical protein C8034_v006015 [Colletotrichum sidae]|uniref:GPI anchored serine-threonine rich protein n=1 Tax=Colletotrichum sidae TaxID=1347389 RepID=A0A4R8T4X8_9PEZI|nr:hypothetical protein C8034_v006015 [Colletotrichum sidae]